MKIVRNIGLTLLICGSIFVAGYKYTYPFGFRGCTLPCMHSALLAYASDNHGQFPASDKNSFAALEKLYPEYTPSGVELAGVSGSVSTVVRALHEKRPLDGTSCSWVYKQGFREGDNPKIAILWESRPGLYPNGRRNFSGGRAVLLIGGGITNVQSEDWEGFLGEQERLCKAAAERGKP